ncbi:hypothetical protein [Maridesulfovibrio sp.]|uniref:hypothetical protein n=1 Tax=Maridesulfovibrio sp. TaxID=2795000 RepID=UPI0037491322
MFVVVLFLCIRFVAYSGENIDFQVQFILAYRWYLIFFMGVLAARMMRVNHIFYLFDKVKLFILCVPFVVAFRVLPKIKEDLEISNKAAIVRGMNKRSLYCVWHKFQSIVFVIVMSLISFVDEYSLQLHARGVNRGLQVFFIKDKMKAHELFVLFYLLMILIYVLGGS